MLYTLAALVSLLLLTIYFLILPLLTYIYDAKNLRKYPNFAPLSGITDLPYCALSAQGFRSKDLHSAHKHAPILRIGPNSLSFGRTAAIKDIYGHSTPCLKDIKYAVTWGSHTHLFDSIDKAEHAEKRKRMAAAFAIKNLERWEHKVASSTGRLLTVLDGLCTGPLLDEDSKVSPADLTVDFNKWINLFTIEAINNIALSSSLGLLEQGSDVVTAQRKDGSTYTARYRESQDNTAYAQSVFVWDYRNYQWLARLPRLLPKWRRVWRDGEPWGDVIYHQAQTRLQRYENGENLDDFFARLMDDKAGQPNQLEWGEIVAEVGAIINAGADTTAIALTQVVDLLIQHPKELQKLREEVDTALDEDEVIAPYDKVRNLPFLRACLDEALRLIPPTSAGLPRRTPAEGASIMGRWIPGDTSVSMTIYSAHRDPDVFPNPEEYCPGRWMDPEERKRMEPFFVAFSTGARGCLGRNITYLEQTVVLASLVHRYEFARPSNWTLRRHEAFNMLLGEMPIKIWRRR
ncbi:cytochrome P450 [Aspergillus avenaceus]|uniref:Cytochrome P450 n=1 Tax=Aspergillus avenaceus TaxID=36643 RepID=A0A5N6U4T0_ASPAV|nr:cytochrome P450 [Aspergillus avenaceus]